jgi:RNA polymerase sigma-70 factor (ECF subfamily)
VDPIRHAAFSEEVLRHVDRLYWFARMLTQDPARAEDLVQQTVLRAFEKADQLRSQADCRPWLFSILRNFHRMSLRHEGAVSEQTAGDAAFVTLEAELYPPPLTPEALVEHELTIEALERAIEALPSLFREVLVLADIEGLSYESIAAAVDCSVGTVKSRLYRARNRLRLTLGAEWTTALGARRATR